MLHRGAGSSLLILTLLLLSLVLPSVALAETRVALVIGNNAYRYVKALENAVTDARAFKKELEQRGFQVVYRENVDRRGMNDAIDEFLGKLSTDAVGLVYYSGHGAQIKDTNYLIPVDLKADKASDVGHDSIELGGLLDRVSQAQAKFSLAIIDACRNNPFKDSGKSIGGKGLSPMVSNANGIMVVYAAGANQEALDRLGSADRNPNGLFTREFLKAMRTPGLKVQDAVNHVKLSVIEQAKSVGHVQTPAIYDQSVGTFYFTGPTTVNVSQPSVSSADPATIELRFWESAEKSGTSEAYQTYLKKYPIGQFADMAKIKIEELKPMPRQQVQPARAAPTPMEQAPVPTSGGARYSKAASGVITDSQTGLQWYLSPDGNYDWGKAKSWVNSLSVGGGGWRMPSRSELAGLRTEKQGDCYFDPIFLKNSAGYCGYVWSGEARDSSSGWAFHFLNGGEGWLHRGFSRDYGWAFAVRSRR